jgi:hypothetical protein
MADHGYSLCSSGAAAKVPGARNIIKIRTIRIYFFIFIDARQDWLVGPGFGHAHDPS